jgi:hypothetical protein
MGLTGALVTAAVALGTVAGALLVRLVSLIERAAAVPCTAATRVWDPTRQRWVHRVDLYPPALLGPRRRNRRPPHIERRRR